MPYIISDCGSNYSPPSEGAHPAVCTMVIDLGPQNTPFGVKPQTFLRFELVDEKADFTDKAGAARSVPKTAGKYYSTSMHPDSTFREHVEGWLGRSLSADEARRFDAFTLLGAACEIQISQHTREGKTVATITGIRPWPATLKHPANLHGELLRYTAQEPDDFDKLPDFLKAKISAQVKGRPAVPPKVQRAPAPRSWIDDVDDTEPGGGATPPDAPPPSHAPDGPGLDDEIVF